MSEYDFDDVGEDSPFLASETRERGQDADADADATAGGRADADYGEDGPTAKKAGPGITGAAWYQAKSAGVVVALISFILFLLVLSATLALVPMVRLLEDRLCRRYYNTTDPVDEKLCKVPEIQAELAWLGGIGGVVDSVIGLTVSFPWGIMSDIVGRKPIFRLSYAGVIMQFVWCAIVVYCSESMNIRWVLLSPAMALIGGGLHVALAVVHSIVADVTTERTSGFIWISIGAILGGVIGPALAAKLMEAVSPWVPILVPFFLLTPLVYTTIFFLPETLPRPSPPPPTPKHHHPTTTPPSPSPASAPQPFAPALRAHLHHTWARLRESLAVLRSRSLKLLLSTFLLSNAAQAAQNQILAQSISTRFGWTLARVGYLMSARGLLTVAVLALLPLAARALSTGGLGMGAFRRDRALALGSLGCLTLGSLLCAGRSVGVTLAGVVVSTFAVGLGSMTKSLVAYYVDAEHTSRMYTLTGMVETLGGLFAGPTLAWSFQAGMRLGGGWLGLPFYYLSFLCVLTLLALCFVREPKAPKVQHHEDGLGSEIEQEG